MIEFAGTAKAGLDEILKRNPGKYLRIVVEGDGCAGPYFRLFIDEAEPGDLIARVDGLDILVSDNVQKVAETSTIKIFLNSFGEDLG